MAYKKILLRRDTSSNWSSTNPVLSQGEVGYETNTNKLKIGDGTTAYNSLAYFNGNLTGSSLNDLADVTIVSAANGDFLRWNGSAWINDAVNLSTDTVGNYVQNLVAGTGVTLSNNSGEAATPTIAIGQDVGTSASVTFAKVTAPVTGDLTGNASTASTLQTSRTILISGDVSGSVSFNGSSDATITTQIEPNSVALGTDTTGSYVQNLVAGTGVTLSNNSGEGATPTIAIGQDVGSSASVTFANVSTTGNVTVGGDLTVSGTTTSINTEILTIDDNIIVLNNNETGTPSQNAGVEVERGTSTNVSFRWNESTDKWEITNDGTNYYPVATTSGTEALTNKTISLTNNSVSGTVAEFNSALSDGDFATLAGAETLTNKTLTSPSISNPSITGVSPVITLAGDLSGSVTLTNLGSGTLTATIGANSVALGDDTTGNYVATVSTSGTGISVSGSGTENASVTISSNATDSNTSSTIVSRDASGNFAAGTITAALSGNASTATTLATSRAIELTGDVTGSASFDGSANATISATIAANSVALGTDTTGNYMSDVSAGTGISVTHTPGEGSTATIGLNATLDNLSNVSVSSPSDGQFLKYISASSEWQAANIPTINNLDDVGDVTITSATSGDFLKWNGTAWVNDPVNLGTDTTGNYVSDVTAGTGITVTHTPGEGSTATIAIPQSIATTASPTFAAITLNEVPTGNNHAVTKSYVDDIAAGINYHNAVELATAAVLPNSPTYNNGTSGVGATLTAGANARLVVDGANATTGDRILVKNQADAKENGIYDVTQQGSVSVAWVLTRSADFDGDNDDVVQGDALFVTNGSNNVNQGFILTSKGTGTSNKHVFGTDSLSFTQFTGASNITAGTGLSKTGNTLSIDSTVVTLADAQTLTNKTLTSPTITGVSPTITLGGDLSGSLTLTNLAGGTLTATIGANSVALGTDTTGNYVADVVAGTGINITHTPGEGSSASVALNATLDNLSNVNVPTPSNGQFLKYVTASSEWQAADIPTINNLDDVGDVTITSAASGDFLKWNGTAWVNDPINLGTDTTGNYMSDVSAGTGVSITHTPSEGSSATIAIGQSVATNANPTFAGATLDAVRVGITAANEIDTTSGNLILDSTAGTVQVDDNVLVTGTTTTRAASTQDSVIIQGRAGGTSSYGVTITPTTLTGSKTLTLPDTTGTVVTTGDTGTVTSTMLADGTIVNADINASAAIALSKLASGTSAQIVLANSSGVPTYTTVSGDVTISNTGVVTIAANSVALGTDTTGNYMTDVSAGTGVSVSHTPAEGSTATISIGQAVGTTDNPTFAGVTADAVRIGITATNEIDTSSGNLIIDSTGGTVTVDDNLIVSGDLTVNGTTTTVNTATLNVSDNIVVLNNDVTGTPTENAGIEVERGTSANVLVRWNETSDVWELTNDGTTYGTIDTTSGTATLTNKTIALGSNTVSGTLAQFNAAVTDADLVSLAGTETLTNKTLTSPILTTPSIGAATGTSLSVTGNLISAVNGNTVTLGTDGQIEIYRSGGGAYIDFKDASADDFDARISHVNATNTLRVAGEFDVRNFANATRDGIVLQGRAGGTSSYAVTLTPTTLSASRTLTLPDVAGTVVTTGDTGTVTSTMIADGTIVNADISSTAAIDLGKLADVSTNAQTASYTLVLGDKNKIVEMNVASANNLTVPLNSSVAYPVGSQINILQTGAGQTTIVATGGVTINGTPGLKLRAQWSYVTLIKRATDTWVAVGDLSA